MAKKVKAMLPKAEDEEGQAVYEEGIRLIREGRLEEVFSKVADIAEHVSPPSLVDSFNIEQAAASAPLSREPSFIVQTPPPSFNSRLI
jgi:hypothetical protein